MFQERVVHQVMSIKRGLSSVEVTEVFVKHKWVGGDYLSGWNGFKNAGGEDSEVRTTGIFKEVTCKKKTNRGIVVKMDKSGMFRKEQ